MAAAPYQSWLSQPSSTAAGGAASLTALALVLPSAPRPQASPPPMSSLSLLLDADAGPGPHASQPSEPLLSAEGSAHVQLLPLGDLWALAGSVLPKVSQKFRSVVPWELSPPLF